MLSNLAEHIPERSNSLKPAGFDFGFHTQIGKLGSEGLVLIEEVVTSCSRRPPYVRQSAALIQLTVMMSTSHLLREEECVYDLRATEMFIDMVSAFH